MAARALILFSSLMALWLSMSGHYTLLVTGLGVASAAFATVMAVRIRAHDSEGLPLHIMARLPGYILWLVREIAVSNLATMRLILWRRPKPVMFRTASSQRTPAGVATYANSITLTPGTVTVAVEGRGLIVHALSTDLANDVRGGGMDRRVSRLEGAARKGGRA